MDDQNVQIGFDEFKKVMKAAVPAVKVSETGKYFVIKVPKGDQGDAGVADGNPIALGEMNIIGIEGKLVVTHES